MTAALTPEEIEVWFKGGAEWAASADMPPEQTYVGRVGAAFADLRRQLDEARAGWDEACETARERRDEAYLQGVRAEAAERALAEANARAEKLLKAVNRIGGWDEDLEFDDEFLEGLEDLHKAYLRASARAEQWQAVAEGERERIIRGACPPPYWAKIIAALPPPTIAPVGAAPE